MMKVLLLSLYMYGFWFCKYHLEVQSKLVQIGIYNTFDSSDIYIAA